jgi:glycosyltransferase involved in cell wall biosynthesis
MHRRRSLQGATVPLTMVTACAIVDAGRLGEARGLAASFTEHEPQGTLSVLVLDRDERAAEPRNEDFPLVTPSDLEHDDVDVLAAAYGACGLALALLPAMLRAVLAQHDHALVLQGVTRLTGSLEYVAIAARESGVLVDAAGRLVGLGRGTAAEALLDEWEELVHSRAGVGPPPFPAGVVALPGPPPWRRVAAGVAREADSGWERTRSGFRMDEAMRLAFREGWRAGRLRSGPFDPFGEEAFFGYLAEPARRGGWAGVTRYMEAVYQADESVRARVGDLDDDGAPELVAWLCGPGGAALDPPPNALSGVPGDSGPDAYVADPPPLGVNVVGYLCAELGVAEVARQLISSLDTQDVPVLPIGISAGTSREDHEFAHVDEFVNPFAVNLLCVNADQTPHVAKQAGRGFFAGRYTIGVWWWEIADFPDHFRSAFGVIDEVWACSGFVADTLRTVSPCPVVRIPMPVTLPAGVRADRARFGFGDDVVFLYLFDYNSIVDRKNPIGLLDAYRRAFPDDSGTRLILKCINHARHPDAHARVIDAAVGRDDIVVMDAYLSAADKDALLASCDCYVSLHRSEGFGLTCAEAMLLGKPVIATGYSGAADYMHAEHSLPVRWRMVPVGPGNEPYPANGEWAEPDLDEAVAHMRAVADHPELRRRLGSRARSFVQREHSPAVAGAAMRARLEVVATLAAPRASVPYALDGLHDLRTLVDTGPSPGTGWRWHPGRLARALALRVTAPRARHQHAIDRRMVEATERAVAYASRVAAAARDRAEIEAWRTTANSLREQRRLAVRLACVETDLARSAESLDRLRYRLDRIEEAADAPFPSP